MRAATWAPFNSGLHGETIFADPFPGNQLSLYMSMLLPLPIFHLMPKEITFLDLRMLCQAKDPVAAEASKIDPLGKYFALKTL